MPFDPASGLYLAAPDPHLEQREKRLAELGLLHPAPALAEELDAFAARLAQESGFPYAMVNFITGHQRFAGLHAPHGREGLPPAGRQMSLTDGYCPALLTRRAPLVLPNVLAAPRFAGNPVVDQIGIHAYAGAQLVDGRSGMTLGTVCVVDVAKRPRESADTMLTMIKDARDRLSPHLPLA